MGGISIHVRFSFGSSECFYCSSNFILSKNKNFRFSQISFIKSIDLKISIFEKVFPSNLSILEFNLLYFISLSVYHNLAYKQNYILFLKMLTRYLNIVLINFHKTDLFFFRIITLIPIEFMRVKS